MPYFMRQTDSKWCVYKGTKKSPGKQMKCYTGSGARGDARKYLATLYMNVEDAQKDAVLSLTGWLKSYQEVGKVSGVIDRWIAVSTVEMWDQSGEMMTTETMDHEIARVNRVKDYPEFRLWHVRGFKLGQCDRMTRVGKYAVDYGYWHSTPLANSVKDLVINNDGKWRVSRAFFPVKATGVCPSCDSSLLVGPVHYMFGMKCPVCTATYQSPNSLGRLKHLETYTYDITVTDVPIVPATALSAWSEQSL